MLAHGANAGLKGCGGAYDAKTAWDVASREGHAEVVAQLPVPETPYANPMSPTGPPQLRKGVFVPACLRSQVQCDDKGFSLGPAQ